MTFYTPPGGITQSDVYSTPQDFFDLLHREFRFTLDVCAIEENAKCPKYFSPHDDGLTQDWGTETIWMNPPYSSVPKWVKKAHDSSIYGAIVVCLLSARTDSRWFHEYVIGHEIRFVRGRLRFKPQIRDADGDLDQTRWNTSPNGSIVVVMRPEDTKTTIGPVIDLSRIKDTDLDLFD